MQNDSVCVDTTLPTSTLNVTECKFIAFITHSSEDPVSYQVGLLHMQNVSNSEPQRRTIRNALKHISYIRRKKLKVSTSLMNNFPNASFGSHLFRLYGECFFV